MKPILLGMALLLCMAISAQQVKLDQHFKNWKPRCIGPSGMSGRITAIDALNDNPNTIYLAPGIEAQVRKALGANLCRCGTHNRIVRAVLRASKEVA